MKSIQKHAGTKYHSISLLFKKAIKYLKLINMGRNIPYIYNHKARYVNDINYDIYRLLNPGDDASDEKIIDIMPYKHRLHCFKDKYYKLVAENKFYIKLKKEGKTILNDNDRCINISKKN